MGGGARPLYTGFHVARSTTCGLEPSSVGRGYDARLRRTSTPRVQGARVSTLLAGRPRRIGVGRLEITRAGCAAWRRCSTPLPDAVTDPEQVMEDLALHIHLRYRPAETHLAAEHANGNYVGWFAETEHSLPAPLVTARPVARAAWRRFCVIYGTCRRSAQKNHRGGATSTGGQLGIFTKQPRQSAWRLPSGRWADHTTRIVVAGRSSPMNGGHKSRRPTSILKRRVETGSGSV